jgi:hypothetical protein
VLWFIIGVGEDSNFDDPNVFLDLSVIPEFNDDFVVADAEPDNDEEDSGDNVEVAVDDEAEGNSAS